MLKFSPSSEANPLIEKSLNLLYPPLHAPPFHKCTQMGCKRKMTNELCLPRLMGIIMLMDVYGVVWENHVVEQKCSTRGERRREGKREYIYVCVFY